MITRPGSDHPQEEERPSPLADHTKSVDGKTRKNMNGSLRKKLRKQKKAVGGSSSSPEPEQAKTSVMPTHKLPLNPLDCSVLSGLDSLKELIRKYPGAYA